MQNHRYSLSMKNDCYLLTYPQNPPKSLKHSRQSLTSWTSKPFQPHSVTLLKLQNSHRGKKDWCPTRLLELENVLILRVKHVQPTQYCTITSWKVQVHGVTPEDFDWQGLGIRICMSLMWFGMLISFGWPADSENSIWWIQRILIEHVLFCRNCTTKWLWPEVL